MKHIKLYESLYDNFSIEGDDIIYVAKSLGMNIDDDCISWILSNYDDYAADREDWNWTEIIEEMLNDYETR